MLENLTEIPAAQLLADVQQMRADGYRFITASCVENTDGTNDVIYHFDREGQLKQLRVTVSREEAIPSISCVYLCAFLVENEIQELFGVKIANIAVDYGGRLLLAEGAPSTPMAGGQITIEQR